MGVFSSVLSSRSWSPLDDRWYLPLSPTTKSGVRVSERDAMKYLTVFACVSLVAGDIAKLPLVLYRRKPDGSRERVIDHPVYDLIHNAPNPEMTSYNWREAKQGHLMLWGDTYDQIIRNGTNGIDSLWPLNPDCVEPYRKNGALFYKYQDDGKEKILNSEAIFHIPGFGFNGIKGMSMISLAREAIGLGLATEEFGENYFGKGTHPSGALETDAFLGDKRDDFISKFKEQYSGLGKSHSVVLLEGGVKYKPFTVPLEDAQFLQTREFQKLEICGFYHVPPHKIAIHGKNSNYNNLEQENQNYVDSCLSHWCARWEQSINHQLLTVEERKSGLFAEHLLSGLLRGDSQARGEFYKTLFNMGYPLNRILAKENENPVDGGDTGYIQLNMVPIGMAGDIQKDKKQSNSITKEDARVFFRKENRGIIVRDRIIRQYYPLFKQAAQSIVNREGNAIKRKLEQRSKPEIEQFLKDFYRTLPDYIKEKFGPTFMSFAEAIRSAAGSEIGIDPENIDQFVTDFINRYSERHVESSEGQLLFLLEEENGIDEIQKRVDEWEEKRPDKIATNETTRLSNGVFQIVAFAAGLKTIWRIRGAETCPYCRSLNGKKISSGQYFVNDGDELNPKGAEGPMKIRGLKRHPPLHAGCDCYVAAG